MIELKKGSTLQDGRNGEHNWIKLEEIDGIECLRAPTGTLGITTDSLPSSSTIMRVGSHPHPPPLLVNMQKASDWGRDCWCPREGQHLQCFGWQGELPEGYDHKYIYNIIIMKTLILRLLLVESKSKSYLHLFRPVKRNWIIWC